MKYLVIFSHGKESSPKGSKITALSEVAKQYDCEVVSVDYTFTTNPEERVNFLEQEIQKYITDYKLILVGSSMGGYVSTLISKNHSIEGLFVMAPAFFLNHYAIHNYDPSTENITIIHGWEDSVVSCRNSIQFAEQFPSKLVLVHDEHRLANSIPLLKDEFQLFLKGILKEEV